MIIRTLAFTILVEPKSVQHGARAKRMGKGILFYNDPDKEKYIAKIKQETAQYCPASPISGPCEVSITFYLPRPDRCNAKGCPDGAIPAWGLKGVDCDNLCKGTQDGLTKAGFWINDSQVFRIRDEKFHCERYLFPRIEIIINEYSTDQRGLCSATPEFGNPTRVRHPTV
jgi:Holliday junction resolvase RusA-like endonuclease